MTLLRWTGPFRIRELLDGCLDEAQTWPPKERGVYVVSRDRWDGAPSALARPLYVGGNTGSSPRLCTRLGDLIADMHGFFGQESGHHTGGQSLYRWCEKEKVPPGALFLGWGTRDPWCARCAEVEAVRLLAPSWAERGEVLSLNKNRPPACRAHGSCVR